VNALLANHLFRRRSAPLSRQCAMFAVCMGLLVGCKTSVDAAATATQLSTTSQDLAAYYGAMSGIIEDSASLGELQSSMLGTSFGPQDIVLYQDTELELQKRAALAKSLQALATAFSQLSGSTAASDVSTSANNLATELVSIKALPSGPPIPDALGQAAKAIVTLIQERQERKATALLDGLILEISKLFSAEKPIYESLYATYFALADSLDKRGIATDRDKPLHSLVGEYIKRLKEAGDIESEMTERILKSSISILEAFNRVRNEQSFAHDNPILNYDESLLIFNHVTSAIKFIERLERRKAARAEGDESALIADGNIPF